MIDIALIRQDKDSVIAALNKRKPHDYTDDINQIVSVDVDRRAAKRNLDELQAQANKMAKEIGQLYKSGEGKKAEILKQSSIEIRDKVKVLQADLDTIEEKLTDLLFHVPNVMHESVKAGKNEADNEYLYTKGDIDKLGGYSTPHWDISDRLGLIDFVSGAKITGSGFPVFKRNGAKLQRALTQFFLDYNVERGYDEYIPPFLVNAASASGTGQLPDKDSQMYHTERDQLYLIPTAEVPLTNIYRDAILTEQELPIRMTGHTPCFRREAGSYGKDVKGLNRLHQFEKVEVVQITTPQASEQALQEMVQHVEGLLDLLDIPYRLLRLCGGDTGFAACVTYDFEVFSAGQKRWLEVSSVSNFASFQATRMHLRYRGEKDKKTHLCHTLNGSSLALPRIYAALIENHYSNSRILLPEALRPYYGAGFIS